MYTCRRSRGKAGGRGGGGGGGGALKPVDTIAEPIQDHPARVFPFFTRV